MRLCAPLLILAASGFVHAQWIESKSTHYSILYQSGYEKDAVFTQTVLDHAEDLLKSKYGVPVTGFRVAVYLYPAPTRYAGTGLANLQCCSREADGTKTGTISYLAPSAPAWKDATSTSLGLPKDENYHAKVLMSEYMTVGHYIVQESRVKTGGWRYGGAPEWVVQGLQESRASFTQRMQIGRSRRQRFWSGRGLIRQHLRAVRLDSPSQMRTTEELHS